MKDALDIPKMYIISKLSFSEVEVNWTKTFQDQLTFWSIVSEDIFTDLRVFTGIFFFGYKALKVARTNSQVSVVDRKSMV